MTFIKPKVMESPRAASRRIELRLNPLNNIVSKLLILFLVINKPVFWFLMPIKREGSVPSRSKPSSIHQSIMDKICFSETSCPFISTEIRIRLDGSFRTPYFINKSLFIDYSDSCRLIKMLIVSV